MAVNFPGAGLFAVAMVFTSSSLALAETQATPVSQAGSSPAAEFGAPPSGQIPILYNDRHVYTKPDILKQGRVLAALARGGEIDVPLRSMFEQMGATVSYDPSSKTATVSKAGAEVVVTVGKPQVVINGESRPLDVPPIIYRGDVLVPVRVISEGMGAYVQWVPDRHIVVVRYIPGDAAADRSAAAADRSAGAPSSSASTTEGDSQPANGFRLLSLLLLHAPECVEQSRRAVQLFAGCQICLKRCESVDLDERRGRPCRLSMGR